jgi:ribosomal protein S17E
MKERNREKDKFTEEEFDKNKPILEETQKEERKRRKNVKQHETHLKKRSKKTREEKNNFACFSLQGLLFFNSEFFL